MRRTPTALAGVALAGGLLLTSAPAAFADSCNTVTGEGDCTVTVGSNGQNVYSGGGETVVGGGGGENTPGGGGAAGVSAVQDTQNNRATPSTATLPFTGGEISLMLVVGLGALAGGGVLVAGGRRRRATDNG